MFGLRSAQGRAIVAGVVLVALLASFAALAVQRVHDLERQHDSLQQTAAVATALEQARAQLFEEQVALAGLAFSGDPGLVDAHHEAVAALKQDLSQARVGMLAEGDADEVLALEDLTERIGGFNEEIANAIPSVLEADPETRLWLASAGTAEMSSEVDAFTAELDRLAESEQNELAAKTAAADRATETTLWLFVGFGATAFLVAAGTVAMLVFSVVRPLASLRASARAITEEGLQVRAKVAGPEEIASLARDFNEMTDALWARTKEYIDTTNLTGDIIVRLDKDGMFTFLNDGACEFFGRSREELLGTDAAPFMHAEDLERAGQAVREVIESKGLVRGFQSHLVTPMGTRVVEWNGYPLFDGEGQYAGIQITGRDTTERKQMEEALYAKTQEYVATANLTEDIVCRADEEGRWVFLNDAACQFFGKSREELLETDARASLHPEDLEPTVQAVQEAAATREPIKGFVNRQLTPMGTRVVEWNASPLFDGEGRYSGIQMTGRDITERKQMEEELRESEEKYRRLVQNSTDGIAIVQGLEIKFVNRAILKMFGYQSEKEMVGHPFSDFLSPQWRDVLVERTRARQEGKRIPARYEFRALRKDGSEFHGEVSVGTITYQGSAALQAIVRDVTERKRAEEAVRESEEKYRRLVEDSIDGIAIVQGVEIRFINQAAVKMFGYQSENELVGRPFMDFVSPEYRELMTERARARQAGEDVPSRYDFRALRKDGTEFHAELSVGTITYQGSAALQAIVRDVTERKRAEEELQSSEERLKILFEFAPDGYYLNDLQGNFVDGNRAAEELIGYKRQELIGKSLLEVKLLPPEQIPKAAANLAKNAQGLPTGPDEFTLNRKDGTQVPVGIRTFPVRIADQTLVLGIARDITERKQMEEGLRESEERYRLLAENATDIIWTMDLGLRYTYVSPSVTRMRGYTAEELVGKTVQETLTPASLEIARKTLAEELAMEKTEQKDLFRSRTLELEMYCKDGSTVCTEVKVAFLRNPDGQPVGILGVTRDISERKRAEEEIHRRNEELALFLELSKTVASTIEVSELVERALDRVTSVLPQADAVTLAIYDRDKDALEFKAARGVDPKAYLEIVLKPGEGMAGKAFTLGKTVLYSSPEEMRAALTDMSSANRQLLRAATQEMSPVQSAICCPLVTDGRVLGVLTSATSAADAPFGPGEAALLDAAADHIAIALHKAQLHAELQLRAVTDSLTDLYDHAQFYRRLAEEIERSKRYNHGFAVVMLDVDDFKRFNDSRGHQAGDEMLRFVADCIQSGLRRSDLAFRYGGDEFAAILPHADPSKARAAVNRINRHLTSSLKQTDGEAADRLSLSAGVACFPDDGTTADDLVRIADAALYSAKWIARARDIMGQSEDIQSLVSTLVSRRAGVEAPADGAIFRPEALHEQHARIVSSVASSIAVALKDAGVSQALEDPDLQILAVVGAAAEIKDRYIRGHPERTSQGAVAVAEAIGLSPERVRDIQIAGLLHDIGKVTVSEGILNKSGRLTRREFATIKEHPIVGATLVSQARGFERLVPIIGHHHERFDGNGYPDGLAGEEIPLEARILSVVDVFDALTHERSYRKAMSREEAIAELERGAGTQFDPTVVKAFLASVKRRGEEPAAPAQAASEDRQLAAARVPGRGKR